MFCTKSPYILVAVIGCLSLPPSAEAARKSRVKRVYVVKKGDSLTRISRQLKVSVKELRWWNPKLGNARAMRPGRQLTYFARRRGARGAKAKRGGVGTRKARASTRPNASSRPARTPSTKRTSPRIKTRARSAPLPLRMADETAKRPEAKSRSGGDASKGPSRRGPKALAKRSDTSEASRKPTKPKQRPAKDRAKKTDLASEVRAQLKGVATEQAPKIASRRRLKRQSEPVHQRPGPDKAATSSKRAPAAPAATSKRVFGGRRGMSVLSWMGRAKGRMPARNPTADMLPKRRSKPRAEVIGSPSDGRILRAQEMPKSLPGVRSINRAKRFACDQTLEIIAHVGRRLQERYPGTRPLLVGALSYEKGGRAGRHKSHQNGLDVDIAYFERGNPKRRHYNGRVRWDQLDYDKNWFVFETMLLTGKINYIFVDRAQLPHFRAAAARSGWSEPALRRIFGDASFRGPDRIIRHWKGHTYHAHVRFTCPRSDPRCVHSRY